MLSVGLMQHLLKPFRHLAWLARIEKPSGGYIYMWSGSHHMTYEGNVYLGYGYLSSIEPVRYFEGTEHVEQTYELNGVDPSIIGDLDDSVRGLDLRLSLAAIGNDRQIVPEPYQISQMIQDTLGWSYNRGDGTATLRLTAYDAMPLLGRATGTKFSNEDQQERYPGDDGFSYNSRIAMQGPAVTWVQA